MTELYNQRSLTLSRRLELQETWRLFPELYGCLFIDISWIDVVYAFSCILSRTQNYEKLQNNIETFLGGPERILISLSVRSSFDLFLQAMKFPPGSELISTCINIQQMSAIAEHHGVHLKAVDIDLSNLKPNIAEIEFLITDKTVGIMVVQLFGMKFRVSEITELARKHGILVIEDCAQAFFGPQCLQTVKSDIAFFSFGSIKRFTCLGGACVVCNDPSILERMRKMQRNYAILGRYLYFSKLFKTIFFMIAMNHPFIAKVLSSCLSVMGIDYKVFVKSRLRSFTKGSLIEMIRFRPSTSLLLLLRKRMKSLNDEESCMKANTRAEYAISCLIEQPTYVVGCLSEIRDFWLFPVLVDNPIEVEQELEKFGVSAFAKASSLIFTQKPSESLKSSEFLCKHVLYLPIDRRVPKWHIDYVCKSLVLVLKNRRSIFGLAEHAGVSLKRDVKTLLKHTAEKLCLDTEQNSALKY